MSELKESGIDQQKKSQCQNAETHYTASSYCTLMLTRRMQNAKPTRLEKLNEVEDCQQKIIHKAACIKY